MKILPQLEPYAHALLRIVAGLMFLMHGTQKLFGWPGNDPPIDSWLTLRGAAGIIEVVCGALIVVGLMTGIAAFIASGEMAVAYFMVHFGQSWNPLLNHGEAAAFYCFLWLYFATHGAGIWSLDHQTRKRPAG